MVVMPTYNFRMDNTRATRLKLSQVVKQRPNVSPDTTKLAQVLTQENNFNNINNLKF